MRKWLLTGIAAAALSGCASMGDLRSEVTTYSQWPAQRKPATYVFERLPSQRAHPEQQKALEDAARRGLEAAGFTPAADEAGADVSVQVGARVNANEPSPWADPFWWHGGLYYGRWGRPFWGPRFGGPWGPGWAARLDTTTYEREVALLIRDRKTGEPLYEARASNDGISPSIKTLLPAMFEAALKGFPNADAAPREVTTRVGS